MVTGNNPDAPLIWWTQSDRPTSEFRGDLCLAREGNRYLFLLFSGPNPLFFGAVDQKDWNDFLGKIAPCVTGKWLIALPSSWYTLLPEALHADGFAPGLITSLGGNHRELQEYRCLKQNVFLAYQTDLPREIKELAFLDPSHQTQLMPSEALDWEFPSLNAGRHLVVQLGTDRLQISAFENSGTLVFSNRFDAPNANDALYVLGLAYEHTGWSGLNVPLFWHGRRPDWEAIQQALSAFVLEIKPLAPPKALPDVLGDWRSHPSLQSLYRLWLCAS